MGLFGARSCLIHFLMVQKGVGGLEERVVPIKSVAFMEMSEFSTSFRFAMF